MVRRRGGGRHQRGRSLARNRQARIVIGDTSGREVLAVSGSLSRGDHQADPEPGISGF